MSKGSLLNIKNRASSVGSIRSLTKSLEMAASAKFKSIKLLEYFSKEKKDKALNILKDLDIDRSDMDKGRNLYIFFSSDQSLCGSFNSAIFKSLKELLNNDDLFITKGKQISNYIRKNSLNLQYYDENSVNFDRLAKDILNREIEEIIFVYNRYSKGSVNIEQERVSFNEKDDYIVKGYRKKNILSSILEELYNSILVQSNLGEQFSRMIFMQSANKNSEELLTELNRSYNNKRKQIITKEIIEIINGV